MEAAGISTMLLRGTMLETCPNDQQPIQLLSLREAASSLAVSPFTLRRYCRLGQMPHYRIFGRIKFSIQQIEDFKLGSKIDPRSNKATNYILMLSSGAKAKPPKVLYKASR